MSEQKVSPLVGKSIMSVTIERNAIVFETTDNEKVTYETEGDCCSDSYMWSISHLRCLFDGGKVTSLEPASFDSDTKADEASYGYEPECVAGYAYAIKTEHGPGATFAFHNHSNGYYGGWLQGPGMGW